MAMIIQNTVNPTNDPQNAVSLCVWIYRLGLHDSKTYSSLSESSLISIHHLSPTRLLPVRFLVVQKSMEVKIRTRMKSTIWIVPMRKKLNTISCTPRLPVPWMSMTKQSSEVLCCLGKELLIWFFSRSECRKKTPNLYLFSSLSIVLIKFSFKPHSIMIRTIVWSQIKDIFGPIASLFFTAAEGTTLGLNELKLILIQ